MQSPNWGIFLCFFKILLDFVKNQQNMLEVTQKLSNLQLELLKNYSNEVSDEDLKAIHLLMSKYFANKAIEEVNRV